MKSVKIHIILFLSLFIGIKRKSGAKKFERVIATLMYAVCLIKFIHWKTYCRENNKEIVTLRNTGEKTFVHTGKRSYLHMNRSNCRLEVETFFVRVNPEEASLFVQGTLS